MNTNFIDFQIAQLLLSRFGKQNFSTLIDSKLHISYDNFLPEEQVFFMEQLYKKWNFQKELQDLGLEEIFKIEQSISRVLFDMETEGVRFDTDRMNDIKKRLKGDIVTLETQIFELVGERINLNSPKQLQVLFFEKLGIKPIKKNKTGFSVDTDVLEEISKTHSIAGDILKYRSLTKLYSTYVEGLLKAVDLRDGRIHTHYDSLGTTTGRMSSTNPNLQNIPSGDGYADEIKSCFIPSKGNIFLVADYSQIELRILAFLSQDDALLQAFRNHEDIHTRTARFLFGEKEISSHERRIAKSVNFGVIYGITGFGLSKTLGCSPWEAQKYVDAFYEKYPSVKNFYEKILEDGRKNGFVETFFGRKRFLPALNDANKTLRSIAEREAMNMPIQGTAADVLKLSMIEIQEKIKEKKLSGKMILQVHDELVFDIPLGEKDIFENIIRDSMESILKNQTIKEIPKNIQEVPLIVDIGFGNNWLEAK